MSSPSYGTVSIKLIGIAVLFLLIWIAYYPSLGHMPRADQGNYLADSMQDSDFSSTLRHTYSYNRTRITEPGDVALFRPVLFTFLALEKALFGNNFDYWQAMGVLLHFVIACLMLQLMSYFSIASASQIEPYESSTVDTFVVKAFPFVLTLFFALHFAIQEMVIWTHIHGYLLFIAFALGALLLGFRLVSDGDLPKRRKFVRVVGAWCLTLLATFTYELGQFFSLLLGFFIGFGLSKKGEMKKIMAYVVLFASIAAIYQIVNLADMKLHSGQFNTDIDLRMVLKEVFHIESLQNARRFIKFSVFQPFFPSLAKTSFAGERLHVSYELKRAVDYEGFTWFALSLIVLSLWIVLSTGAMKGFQARAKRGTKSMVMLLAVTFFFYMGLIIFGRMNMRPHPGLLNSSVYYNYFSLVFVVLISHLLFMGGNVSKTLQYRRSLVTIFLVGSVLMALYNAQKVRRANEMIATYYRAVRDAVDAVNAFVEKKKNEDDFSVAFDLAASDPLPTWHGIPMMTVLFRQYENNFKPKYVVEINNKNLIFQPVEEYRKLHPERKGQLFPHLVEIGHPYNVFYYDGYYFGVLHDDGYYDPRRKHYAYLIREMTLPALKQQQRVTLTRRAEDVKSGKVVPDYGTPLRGKRYKGFNFFQTSDSVYAIPEEEGSFDASRIKNHGYSRWFIGTSVEEVRRLIDQSATGGVL